MDSKSSIHMPASLILLDLHQVYIYIYIFSSFFISSREHAYIDNHNKAGFNFRSQTRKQISAPEKKFNVVPLGDIPPELVKHLEMRNPSGFVYTVPESNQTVEFWENVKNKPQSSINLLDEMKSSIVVE